MSTTETESEKQYKRLMAGLTVAGQDHPIYSSGLQRSSFRASPESMSDSQKNTDGDSRKSGSPSNRVAGTLDPADGMFINTQSNTPFTAPSKKRNK
jgi:hypothetical protein